MFRITKRAITVTLATRPRSAPRAVNIAAARARRAAAVAIAPDAAVVELMADDANAKVRRVRVLDPVERAFRVGKLSEEEYRLARCVESDVLALLPPGGGLRLERLRDDGRSWRASDGFVLMPRAPGVSTRAPQARRDDALDALARAERAIGPGPAYAVLRAFCGDGLALYEIERRWRRKRGWALAMVRFALDRMSAAQVYERRKWAIDVLAAA